MSGDSGGRKFNNQYGPGGPCRWCDKREIGCHGKCEDYKEWKALRTQIRQAEKDESWYREYVAETKVRMSGRKKTYTKWVKERGRKK